MTDDSRAFEKTWRGIINWGESDVAGQCRREVFSRKAWKVSCLAFFIGKFERRCAQIFLERLKHPQSLGIHCCSLDEKRNSLRRKCRTTSSFIRKDSIVRTGNSIWHHALFWFSINLTLLSLREMFAARLIGRVSMLAAISMATDVSSRKFFYGESQRVSKWQFSRKLQKFQNKVFRNRKSPKPAIVNVTK